MPHYFPQKKNDTHLMNKHRPPPPKLSFEESLIVEPRSPVFAPLRELDRLLATEMVNCMLCFP